MQSLIFLNRFYWPDVAATGQMLTDLAEDLVAAGVSVRVITSRSEYGGGAAALAAEELRNGVAIRRVRSTRFGRASHVARILDSASYLAGTVIALLRAPRADAVVVLSDPPLVLAPAWAIARLRGMRVLAWPQDLYPELAVELGVLRADGLLDRVLRRINRYLYARVDGILALGAGMAERLVAAGAPPGRVRVAENWADADAIRPVPAADNAFVREHGLDGRFVVLYSGNAGRGHTFDELNTAMRRLRERTDMRFVFIGGGKRMGEVRAAAQVEPACDALFLDYQPRERLHESLSSAAVSIVTERPEVAGMLVPSKTYGILASGRPIVFVGSPESDVARIVTRHACGVVVPAGNADALVAALCRLADDPEAVQAMGARARAAAEQEYGRHVATARWQRLASELLRPARLPDLNARP